MVVIVASIIAASVLAGCANRAPGALGARLNATEKMMWSTYPLATRTGMGTGFVIARGGARGPAMVTSIHVLKTAGAGGFVVGSRVPNAGGGADVALIQFQPVHGRESYYTRHASQDIAAFAVHLPETLAGVVDLPTFLDEHSLISRAGVLRTGDEVSFLGFPDVLPGTVGAFPVLRTGRVASYPPGMPAAHGLFVVDADVYPGDSGAPVFSAGRRGHPELVGMIIRRVGTDRRAVSHFAIAVDASAIIETLRLLDSREDSAAPARGGGGQDRRQLRQPAHSGGPHGS
jgi:hypothetical protein